MQVHRNFEQQVSEQPNNPGTPALATLAERQVVSVALKRECDVFSQYLVSQWPTRYVSSKYLQAHDGSSISRERPVNLFDKCLLKVAGAHPLATKLVDTYASVFLRRSIVRKKLILLLAILESCAPTYTCFDEPDQGSKAALCLAVLRQGGTFGITLLLSALSLMPVRLALAISSNFYGRDQ